MSRMKRALVVTGLTVAAGAAGWAVGLLTAPASGRETRRRLAWRAEDRWWTVRRASDRLMARAVDRAVEEIEERRKRVGEAMAARMS